MELVRLYHSGIWIYTYDIARQHQHKLEWSEIFESDAAAKNSNYDKKAEILDSDNIQCYPVSPGDHGSSHLCFSYLCDRRPAAILWFAPEQLLRYTYRQAVYEHSK